MSNRIFFALAFLFLALPATACAEWAIVRGSGSEASFESSARPTVAVKVDPEFLTVAQGKMSVMLTENNSLYGMDLGTVWYCLSGRNGAQIAAALADAGSRQWYPGILGTNLSFIRELYVCSSDKPESVTQRVFIRPVQLDPWMPAFAAHGMGWNANVMVSQYEWIVNNGECKLLVEYREPCASEHCPVIIPEQLQAFIQRANTAFSARFSKHGTLDAASIHAYGWNSAGVSARLLSTVLGTTSGYAD